MKMRSSLKKRNSMDHCLTDGGLFLRKNTESVDEKWDFTFRKRQYMRNVSITMILRRDT